MLTSQELKGVLQCEPFQPFRVHLKDGRAFDIVHQDSNRVWGDEFIVGMDFSDGPDPLPTYFNFLDVTEIDRVEPLHGSNLRSSEVTSH